MPVSNKVANSETFPAIARELRASGIHSLCFDPNPKGYGDVIVLAKIELTLTPLEPESAPPLPE